MEYDVVSFNIGSRVPVGALQNLEGRWIMAKPLDNFPIDRRQLLELLKTNRNPSPVVIGGRPAGVEVSGNLARVLHD